MNKNITYAISEKIERANLDFSLFENRKGILVGLSGGADSVCLLINLKALGEKYGFCVYALHINHLIRGKEADRDEQFSRDLCKKLGVEFFCERVDIPAISLERKMSTELTAREERYRLFEKVCRDNGLDCIATAHTQSDSCETVLFNLIRGSSSQGLCGIPAKRKLCDGIDIIRPLIYVTRYEVEEFLKQNNQDFITDSSNLTNDYTRNYLRNEIIPCLKKINPALEESISRMSCTLKNDCELLSRTADENFTDELCKLSLLDYSILSRIIIKLFAKYSCETPDNLHIRKLCDEIYKYANTPEKMPAISFTCGFIAECNNGKLTFTKDLRQKEKKAVAFEQPLHLGENFFEHSPFALLLSYDNNKDIMQTICNNKIIYKKYTTDYLYFDTIPDSLYSRNRRESDVIFHGNMHKKLKRIFNSADFDKNLRDTLPLICAKDKSILLVPSVCVSDALKKNKNKSHILYVTLYKKELSFKE